MKRRIITFVIVAVEAVLQGCGGSKQEHKADLVVVEQKDSVYGGTEMNEYNGATFVVDVPTDGPQVLVDSVMGLLNRELYKAFEDCAHFDENVVTFSAEEVFTSDGQQLLGNYMKQYGQPVKDNLWKTFALTLKMEAQTEKYVTYGMEHFHCGGSCGSEKYYFTFDKKDGHVIQGLITHDSLVRFFEENPELGVIENDAWAGMPGWTFSPDLEFENTSFGLLDDRMSLVVTGVGNHYGLIGVPYDKVNTYLSSEAQALLK